MLYLVLLALTFFVQLFSVSWYIMSEGIKGRQKSLKYKMLCSLLFVADVFLAAAIKQSFSSTYFMLIAGEMLLCLAGDAFLNIEKDFSLPLGMAFFVLAKCCGCAAYSEKLLGDFGVPYFSIPDVAATLVLTVLLAVTVFINKPVKAGKMKIPVIIYGLIIFAGVVKAVHLGILCQQSGAGDLQSMSFALIMGNIGFAASDAVLLLMFFGNKNSRKNSLLNAYLYYFGQMLIACSVLFAGGNI